MIFNLIVGYFFIHSMYFLLIGKATVFLMEFQWLLYFLASFFFIWDIRKWSKAEDYLISSYLFILFIEGLIGILTSFTGPLFTEHVLTAYDGRFLDIYRAIGTIGSANGFAGLLASALVITLYSPKLLYLRKYFLLPVFAVALICSQSKSGMLSCIVSMLSIALLRSIMMKSSIKLIITVLVIISIGIIIYNFNEIFTILSDDYVDRISFTDYVLEQYIESGPIQMLFGLGFRQTAFINSDTQGWVTAHNSYISFLAEIGIIGLALLVVFLLTSILYLLKTHSWNLLGGLLVILFHFFTEGFLYGYYYINEMCFIFALTFHVYDKKRLNDVLN